MAARFLWIVYLEGQLQAKLNLAGAVVKGLLNQTYPAPDPPSVTKNTGRRIAELRTVEQVEELAAELQARALSKLEGLAEGEVHIEQVRAEQQVPPRCTESTRLGRVEGTGIKIQVSISHRPGILSRAAGSTATGYLIHVHAGIQVGPVRPEQKGRPSVSDSRTDGEGNALLQGNDPADLPAAEDVGGHPARVQERFART